MSSDNLQYSFFSLFVYADYETGYIDNIQLGKIRHALEFD